ncbi:hypothetical protein ARMSODRAFT_1016934 [Armillaria solidipes]|uniref:Uncharacterized protein n=1 Tax=Armillaria solidipes TaxID=1076256 RepID=A0A2H3C9I7_9AGAR|nr:hypothetical protein ARMSODRAFT_1016934 [Armillaria solidipes]
MSALTLSAVIVKRLHSDPEYQRVSNPVFLPFSDIPDVEMVQPADESGSVGSQSEELLSDAEDEVDLPMLSPSLRTMDPIEDMETSALDENTIQDEEEEDDDLSDDGSDTPLSSLVSQGPIMETEDISNEEDTMDLEAMFDALRGGNGPVSHTAPPRVRRTLLCTTLGVTSDRGLAAHGLLELQNAFWRLDSENTQLRPGELTLNASGSQRDIQNREERVPLATVMEEDITPAPVPQTVRGNTLSRSPPAHEFDVFEDTGDNIEMGSQDIPDQRHDTVPVMMEFNVMVSFGRPDGRVGACVERNMTHSSAGDPLNLRLTFKSLLDCSQAIRYFVATNTRPMTLSQVGEDPLAQLSYHEIGTLEDVINGWSGEAPATPCISCPEKDIIDGGAERRLPCFMLYIVPTSWNILESTTVQTTVAESASTVSLQIVNPSSLLNVNHGPNVQNGNHIHSVPTVIRHTEPAEWARWDLRFTTMIDLLEKLDMKSWNSCYKRFAAVKASIAITFNLGSLRYGRGFNQCLKPVQEWMVARSSSRNVLYLRIKVSTFQNWVSSLWSGVEGIFRRLMEKKMNQGLQLEEKLLYDNVQLWYTFRLEEAIEGRYEPMPSDMLVLSSTLSYERVSEILVRQRRIESL